MYGHKCFRMLALFVSFIILFGCSPATDVMPTETPGYIEKKDIVFLSIDGLDLQLDMAMPIDGEGPFPAIVFIFGGGFREGSRNQYQKQIRWAAERGYVGVTIDYRLNKIKDSKPTNPFPAQVHDVKCAVRWLRSNAEEYKIDKDRIGAVGWSSGGNLALMLALTDPSDGLEGDCGDLASASAIQAAVVIAGPVDLAAPSETNSGGIAEQYLGGTQDEVPDLYVKASPISYVSENDPPVLSIFGDEDVNVPTEQGTLLDAKMKALGLDHELVVLEGKDHFNLGSAGEDWFTRVFAFFDQHLK